MKIYQSMEELIGNTPMIQLNRIEKEMNTSAHLFAKLEANNPAGSIKDRIAKAMIEDAEIKQQLNKDTLIIEPTSGNTGIALAAICAAKGYQLIITMPETMSIERRKLLQLYGAKVVLTSGNEGMNGAVKKANEIHQENKNSIILGQFDNLINPKTHYLYTAKEIEKDMNGKIDFFVAGVGTGGTISGVGKFLKEKHPSLQVVAVEPSSSPILSKGISGTHKIQGIGAGFIPSVLDQNIYDEIICVDNEKAYEYSKMIAQKEGILAGLSSGAALYASLQIAMKKENKGKNIVLIFPDTGERYLSSFDYVTNNEKAMPKKHI